MNTEPRFYVYKMTTDNGGAPCVSDKLLSLAICKPKIRSTADKGAFIFGFGGKDHEERLLYIAIVQEKLSSGSYYFDSKYQHRADCIYEKSSDGSAKRRSSAKYHFTSDQRQRDVGLKFDQASVLLSRDYRYLGREGKADYKTDFPKIKALIEDMKQGHRVIKDKDLRSQLLSLKEGIWCRYPRYYAGKPSESSGRRSFCETMAASCSC